MNHTEPHLTADCIERRIAERRDAGDSNAQLAAWLERLVLRGGRTRSASGLIRAQELAPQYRRAAREDVRGRAPMESAYPLGHGIVGRPSKLRAYGNAIVPQLAAEVIGAFMDCRPP